MKKINDAGVNNNMSLKICSCRETEQISSDLTLSDKQKYEMLIKTLSSKVSSLQNELKASKNI